MKCPNCGEKLKKDFLYCEKCGEEIQIVPDFEPEVDGSILNSLREIQKEVFEEKQVKEDSADTLKEQIKWSYRVKRFQKEHKMAFYVLLTFCVSFCALFIASDYIFLLKTYLVYNKNLYFL